MLLLDHLKKTLDARDKWLQLSTMTRQWELIFFRPTYLTLIARWLNNQVAYLDWLSHTFTIIYTCIIMTHRTTDSLSEYQLLRTSLKLHNYCIHRSTTGIFSMQEWHLFQERFPNRSLYPSITNTTIQLSQ